MKGAQRRSILIVLSKNGTNVCLIFVEGKPSNSIDLLQRNLMKMMN